MAHAPSNTCPLAKSGMHRAPALERKPGRILSGTIPEAQRGAGANNKGKDKRKSKGNAKVNIDAAPSTEEGSSIDLKALPVAVRRPLL